MQTNLLKEQTKEYHEMTSGPFLYNTANYYDATICKEPPFAGISSCRQIYNSNQVDVDSALKGIDRVLTRYETPKTKIDNKRVNKDPTTNEELVPIQRTKKLQRGTIESWEQTSEDYPMYNPQNIQQIVYDEPVRGGLNSRNIARKEHSQC
jgi:hypothetical protein